MQEMLNKYTFLESLGVFEDEIHVYKERSTLIFRVYI